MLALHPLIKDLPKACSLLRDSIDLLPLLTPRSLQREDQQHILGQLSGMASLAVSVLLEAGDLPVEALRLQELGRSVTNSQHLDYRDDISDLTEHYPKLAEEFSSLRVDLDSPLPSLEPSNMSTDQRLCVQQSHRHRRSKVAQDLDDILRQIREKPGFQNFLRAQSEACLLSAAGEGPIVVLNVTALRSDAILVTKAHVKSIALRKLSYASLIEYYSKDIYDDPAVMRTFLEWLWKGAAQPVLQELGFYPKAVEPLPRIWWIGVG